MFIQPPLPPKDYVLKDVNQNQRSCQEFTPSALPRVTQSNLRKFCAPVQYQDNEKLANLQIDFSVNPQVLERWTDKNRAFWVDKPGKNDYFLHDMCKKYTVQVVPSYDVRFKHNERVFYRSFKYELECMEEMRLRKLRHKIKREQSEEHEKDKIIEEKINRNKDMFKIKSCKHESPFWWKDEVVDERSGASLAQISKLGDSLSCNATIMRWQEEPSLTEYVKTDPCRRRDDMALIGMPFRSEACNWYYSHYPPPNLRFRQNQLY